MNFQQLRIVRETVRRNFNLTDVANALFTSQSGVSKHIKDLEDELGVELYVRKGKRILGLTAPGASLIKFVEKILLEVDNIKNVAAHYTKEDSGQLTIATTHTQARYALPKVVTEFKRRYPKVHMKLHQGNPKEIVDLVLAGEADIGIATESLGDVPELSSFPYYAWRHDVVVPAGHPLFETNHPSLTDIAAYPIITYHEGFTGRARIENAFAKAGVTPDIIMSALDADVIKSYVELGLGIGIIAPVAYDPHRDTRLNRLHCSHLFEENLSLIAIRRGHLLRRYAYDFIHLCSPQLDEETVKRNGLREAS
ncbi:MAG: CysB family HTH-type transcriptional regulator [Anaerolineaceae bacterium]|nr:CysB family HTH-type transcriptional regulator [Anaerolineaceae bacterium]